MGMTLTNPDFRPVSAVGYAPPIAQRTTAPE